MIANVLMAVFVITWASCTIGCSIENGSSSTGGVAEDRPVVVPPVFEPEAGSEKVE